MIFCGLFQKSLLYKRKLMIFVTSIRDLIVPLYEVPSHTSFFTDLLFSVFLSFSETLHLHTYKMRCSFLSLSAQFPIKKISCSLQNSPILIIQLHKTEGWGAPHHGHSLPCVTNKWVRFGAVCSFVCTVFHRQRLCVLVLPWLCTNEVTQQALGLSWIAAWQLGLWAELACVCLQYSTST